MVVKILPNGCHGGTHSEHFLDQETAKFLVADGIATTINGEGYEEGNARPSTSAEVICNSGINDDATDTNAICVNMYNGDGNEVTWNNYCYDFKVLNDNSFDGEGVDDAKGNFGSEWKNLVNEILTVNENIIHNVCHGYEYDKKDESNAITLKDHDVNELRDENEGGISINKNEVDKNEDNERCVIVDESEIEMGNKNACDDQDIREPIGDENDQDIREAVGDENDGDSYIGDDDLDDSEYAEGDNDDEDDDDLDVRSFLARMDDDGGDADTDSIEGEHNVQNNPAIDRGYAWIVVIAVFLIHFLLMGYLKSGGVFFVEFQRQFHASASMTSLVIGLSEAVYSLTAFIVLGFLVKIASVRQMCLLGSFFFVLGVVGNAAFDHITFLILTHSLGFGLANGLMYGPSIVIINEYFTKRRALATCIATTGASCGGVAFPFLARLLFDNYGFEGGIIMTGGVIMHAFIAAVLLVPVKYHVRKPTSILDNTKTSEEVPKQLKSKSSIGISFLETLKHRWLAGTNRGDISHVTKPTGNDTTSIPKSSSSIYLKHQSYSVQNPQYNKFLGSGIKTLPLEQFSSKLEICEEGVPLEIQSEYPIDETLQELGGDFSNDKKQLNGRVNHLMSDTTSLASQYSHINGSICSSTQQGGSRNRLDIYNTNNPNEFEFPTGHTSNLLVMSKYSSSRQTLSKSILFQSSSTLNNTIADIISIDQDCKRQSNDQNDPPGNKRHVSGFRKLFPLLCDSPLLRSASFWILLPYFFSAAIGVTLPQIFVVPLAKERGLTDDQASFCLSLLNILDIASHVVPGLIVNSGLMTSRTVCILPMTVVAVVGYLTPLLQSYETIVTLAVLYGLCTGFYFAMQSLIIIDTLGIENFSSCIGIYYLSMGVAGAVSFPIAGALKDMSGTYSSTYYYLASFQVVAVVVLLLLPLARRYDVRRGVLKP